MPTVLLPQGVKVKKKNTIQYGDEAYETAKSLRMGGNIQTAEVLLIHVLTSQKKSRQPTNRL